jgi:chitinase
MNIPLGEVELLGFDLVELGKSLSTVNLHTYNLVGSWTKPRKVAGHTDLRDILKKVRNNILPYVPRKKVLLGLATHGRGFTLSNPACVNIGCPFKEGSVPTQVGGEAGVWTFQEIATHTPTSSGYAPGNAFKYSAFDRNQWIGYDDKFTLYQKLKQIQTLKLGGFYVWSMDNEGQQRLISNSYLMFLSRQRALRWPHPPRLTLGKSSVRLKNTRLVRRRG